MTKEDTLILRFPLSIKEDFKKVKITEPSTSKLTAATETLMTMLGASEQQKKEIMQPVFEMEVYDLSNLLTNVAFNPNRDIEEDRQRLTIYNKKQIQMTHAKVMVQLFNLLNLINLERIVFFYKYPRFSNFCLVLLIIFCLTFDAAYMLSYILSIFIFVFILMNEKWYSNVKPIFDRLFFLKVNPYFNEGLAG